MIRAQFVMSLFLLICLSMPLTSTAQNVDIPDDDLRAGIEAALGKESGAPITATDMEGLTELFVDNTGISDLTGLESATNLINLSLDSNNIADISPLSGLSNLTGLVLSFNNIADISPLSGLPNLTTLVLGSNPLSDSSVHTHIPALQDRGVTVIYSVEVPVESSVEEALELVEPLLPINTLVGHTWWVENLKFSSDGRTLFSVGPHNNMRSWDVLAGEEELNVKLGDATTAIALSPDDQTLAVGSNFGEVLLLNVLTGTIHRDWTAGSAFTSINIESEQPSVTFSPITALAFSADGHTLATGDDRGGIRLWDAATGGVYGVGELEGHSDGVLQLAFSPRHGHTLASRSRDSTVRLWDTATGELKYTWDTVGGIFSLAFSPDGGRIAAGDLSKAYIWDVSTGTLERTLEEGLNGWVRGVAFNPDSRTLATASEDLVQLWDVVTGAITHSLVGHTNWVTRVAFSPVGRTLASGSQYGTILLWELPPVVPEPLYWIERGATSAIRRVEPDDTRIASVVTSGLSKPAELALDVVNRKVYWTDIKAKSIQRANLDGIDVEDVAIAGLEAPNGIALDVTGGMVYWTDYGARKIQRANLDGTGVQDLVTNSRSLLGGITLDVAGGKMYWVDFGRDTIWRANLDGTRVEALVTAGLSIPFAIALDAAGGKIYWADKGTHKIQRSNLDGTDVQDLLTDAQGVNNPNGVALHVASGTMYWTESSEGMGRIKRANLDGSNIQTLFADLDDPRSIALEIEPPTGAMPTPTPESDSQPPTMTDASAQPEDVNGDGVVDAKDILVVVQNFDKTGTNAADVNGDGVVSIADIVQVALAMVDGAAAPVAHTDALDVVTPERVREWIAQAIGSGESLDAIQALERLLSRLTPTDTALLANYPNPFNPETWIPYRLATDAPVRLCIYDRNGYAVRTINLGHRRAAAYESRADAIYWDGRNDLGEQVASGLYFYTLSAGNYKATRKMLIGK